jgi:hypothetical protein
VAIAANHQARARSASTIGMSMMCGGMGKNELSMKEIMNSHQGDWRCAARSITQSYSRLIIDAFIRWEVHAKGRS